jgi:hypothetical protein
MSESEVVYLEYEATDGDKYCITRKYAITSIAKYIKSIWVPQYDKKIMTALDCSLNKLILDMSGYQPIDCLSSSGFRRHGYRYELYNVLAELAEYTDTSRFVRINEVSNSSKWDYEYRALREYPTFVEFNQEVCEAHEAFNGTNTKLCIYPKSTIVKNLEHEDLSNTECICGEYRLLKVNRYLTRITHEPKTVERKRDRRKEQVRADLRAYNIRAATESIDALILADKYIDEYVIKMGEMRVDAETPKFIAGSRCIRHGDLQQYWDEVSKYAVGCTSRPGIVKKAFESIPKYPVERVPGSQKIDREKEYWAELLIDGLCRTYHNIFIMSHTRGGIVEISINKKFADKYKHYPEVLEYYNKTMQGDIGKIMLKIYRYVYKEMHKRVKGLNGPAFVKTDIGTAFVKDTFFLPNVTKEKEEEKEEDKQVA